MTFDRSGQEGWVWVWGWRVMAWPIKFKTFRTNKNNNMVNMINSVAYT